MAGLKKERVVLVNPPNKKIVLRDMYSSTISKGNYNWPCTDLLVISGHLKGFFEVKLLDANTLGLSQRETIDIIESFQPVGICFAFGNSVKDEDYSFVKSLKKRMPDVRNIGTGGLLYHNGEKELIRHSYVDACLLSFVTTDIVKYLSEDFHEINNIIYRDNDKIVRAPIKYPENGYSFPVPLHEQLPLREYRLSHGFATPLTSVVTSFGCPGKCRFCVSENIDFRYRDPGNVLDELAVVKELGIKEVFFRDTLFCANKKQGYAVMRGMIEKGLTFSWVADTSASILNRETVELMKESGCHALHIGVESASSQTLKEYKKNTDLARIKEAFSLCKEYGIRTVGYFVLGLPGETAADVRRTIDFAIELDCSYASFNIPLPIIGSSLREDAIENKWLAVSNDDKYDGSTVPVMETEQLSSNDIIMLQSLAYKMFYFRLAYIIKTLLSPRNFYQMKMTAIEFLLLLKNKIMSLL
ncbi:MAG: radical SAM protein [Bacteroidetes bacterium]|jgi:anaerobic magnesium-protoporphyrin IX monomethyl ester cyclase|nr:radical SAM protein [Bacteroidota bacterium]